MATLKDKNIEYVIDETVNINGSFSVKDDQIYISGEILPDVFAITLNARVSLRTVLIDAYVKEGDSVKIINDRPYVKRFVVRY